MIKTDFFIEKLSVYGKDVRVDIVRACISSKVTLIN